MISVVPVLKQLAPATLRHAIYDRLLDREIPSYPDRVHMRDVILPILAAHPGTNILNVGCRRYSVDINSRLKAAGKSVSTIDIDPDAARWGAQTHIVGDATCLDAYFPPSTFDVVIFNGVFGFGIDSGDEIDRAFVGLAHVLKPGGILLLGWNVDRVADPIPFMRSNVFRPHAGFATATFDDSTHTYRAFERSGN